MDAQFWINAWTTGRTNFHQPHFNDKLIQFFPALNPLKGQRVLVPLCGKSKDMLWLAGLGLAVHGVELYEDAVKAFFTENDLSPVTKSQGTDFSHYTHEPFTLSCGDFFKLNTNDSYDLVYDRGALVALPAPMRKEYAQVIQRVLKKGGNCLLLTYDYDPAQMDGPPFSVTAEEIHALYGDRFSIELLESDRPAKDGARFMAVPSMQLKVYRLKKTS